MNKHSYLLILWLFGLLLAQPSHAQYVSTPPRQDGSISSAEYQNNVYTAAEGGQWYMTWDSNSLYVAKTGGQRTEPTILYLDLDPALPVTGTSDTQGNLTGTTDYGVTPSLPFRADVRVFVNVFQGNPASQYIEVRRRLGNGGWSAPILTDIYYADGGTTNREMRLSWVVLTGGRNIPPSFNWLGYAQAINGTPNTARYDQVPVSQNGLVPNDGGIAPQVGFYFTVANTDRSGNNGSSSPPFDLTSYTFVSQNNNNSFPSINVWDFTMDNHNKSLSRGTTGSTWNIGGSLVVNDGTVYFGSPAGSNFGDTNVGNIRVLDNGVLSMDQTNKPLNVREDVNLTGGAQFSLSGIQGGDLNVGRDFLVTNGANPQPTFESYGRAVTFTGANTAHTIRANNSYVVPFTYLTLSSPSGTITLGSNIAVGKLLTFNQGILNTGSNYVLLDGAAYLGTETATSHVIGNVRITQTLDRGQSNQVGIKEFGNTGLTLIPQNSSTARGEVTVTRVTGTTLRGVGKGYYGSSIQRYFLITSSTASPAGLDLLLTFAYRTDELNGIQEPNLALYQSTTGPAGPYTQLTTPPSANTGAHTISYNYQMPLVSGTYLTLSDAVTPLPVTLVSFTAQATAQGTALLRWATASEQNSKGFGIERQLANGTWQPVGYVAATNHATGSDYRFTDLSLATAPASTQAYYRLRQEDFDGTLSYSPVAVVARTASTLDATQLVLSPVPVSGASLSLTFAEAGQAGSDITVSNAQGQRMLHFTTEASTDVALSLPVEKLTPGVYIVRVQVAGQGARYARFVKQ